MKKTNLDKVLYVLILMVMIGIPILKFCTYVPMISNINPYIVARSRVIFFWITIFLFLTTYVYSIFSKERKINYIDYLFYFLILSLFISTSFSVNFRMSFYGNDGRYEGLLTLLNYYLLALNAKNIITPKYKKNIIKCFICLGIFQSLYSILQALTPFSFLNRKFSGGAYMAMGLCSNPNFFGAYMAMQISIVTIYYLKEGKPKYLLVYALFSMALYLASSSGPVLGFVLSFILFSILFRKQFKRIILLIMVFLFTCFVTDKLLKYIHEDIIGVEMKDRYVISNDIAQTVEKIENDKIESIGSGRIRLWKNSLPLLKEYWLTGSGLDTFGEVYPQSGRIYYDKAHNVYLEMGITNGLLPLIAYMTICLYIFIKGFKLDKTYSKSLFMLFVSYCILAFANISVIDVAPYFYIFIGILLSEVKKVKLFNKN